MKRSCPETLDVLSQTGAKFAPPPEPAAQNMRRPATKPVFAHILRVLTPKSSQRRRSSTKRTQILRKTVQAPGVGENFAPTHAAPPPHAAHRAQNLRVQDAPLISRKSLFHCSFSAGGAFGFRPCTFILAPESTPFLRRKDAIGVSLRKDAGRARTPQESRRNSVSTWKTGTVADTGCIVRFHTGDNGAAGAGSSGGVAPDGGETFARC